MDPKLALDPAFTFAQLDMALSGSGWKRGIDTSVALPMIPGEPEFASWSKGEGERISYTFNPVVRLRVLVFYGERAKELSTEAARVLPTLEAPDIRQFLQSDDPRTLLLGIFAARELHAFDTIELLDALRSHSHERVAAAARDAHAEILRLLVETGVERLQEEKRKHPERSVLFPHLGDAAMRRQILRWLIRDYKTANEHITGVLRAGLADDDWEVRTTAMLAAARLGARELSSAIRRLDLQATLNRPDYVDQNTMQNLRQAVLNHLEGTNDQVSTDDDLLHLRRCVAGLPTDRRDGLFLLVNALTQPLDLEGPEPELPPSIVEEQGEYHLKQLGLALQWIAAVPHWLGTDDSDIPIPNPIRQVTPNAGFFIAQIPLTATASRQDALDLCERLGDLEGLSVTLPTADQWEMAARGTDGRRYPWGNELEGDPDSFASPWGIEQIGRTPEWTSTVTHTGQHVTCGGDTRLRCAWRNSAPSGNVDSQCAVRPVVLLPGR